jgi:pimeloyl-ACP methyl ester carboxylesterase
MLEKFRLGVIFLGLFAGCSSAWGEPVPPGVSQMMFHLSQADLLVHTYRPQCHQPSLLIVLHGLGRNAEGYMNAARPLADRHCLLIAAPLFDKERFPTWRYQQGGIAQHHRLQPPSQWTGRLVVELAERIGTLERRNMPYSIIGHSAGGQFLSRFAAFVPTDAQRIVIANPSTYVWPSLSVDAPFGLGGVYSQGGGEAALRRYLELPITIYLGGEDTGEKDLNESAEAKAQGANRRERGLNAFTAAQLVARERSWKFNWRLVEAKGVGHSARDMFASPSAWRALRAENIPTTRADAPPMPRPDRQTSAVPVDLGENKPVCVQGSWAQEGTERRYVCLSWFFAGQLYAPTDMEEALAHQSRPK